MELTPEELQRIGQYTVNIAGIMCAMGHESAAGSTQYVEPVEGDPLSLFVLDMFTATLYANKGDRIVNGARERIHEFVERHDVLDLIGEAVTR